MGDSSIDGSLHGLRVGVVHNEEPVATEVCSAHDDAALLETSAEKYSPYVRERLLLSAQTTAVDYLDALQEAHTIRGRWDAALADCDSCCSPACPAWRRPLWSSRSNWTGSRSTATG
jgi:Asp-tRNA(Asn)/Glu-tRNA(Gln) amidotransferase A subunit family amidase